MNAIELDHISKSFGRFRAVDDLSIAVPQGVIFGLLGPNGAGKTTTIRMIMNITAPDTGQIRVLGAPSTRDSLSRVGYLPEERGLYRRMRVIDQLLFLAAIKEVPAELAKQRIGGWLDAMELRPWLNKKVDELSKGMQQKIQFIATIVHDPEILILDEPFSGLDPINVNLIRNFLIDFRSRGKTIIFSTHVLEQAEKLCDSICLVTRAKKILEGNMQDLKRRYTENTIRISTDATAAELSKMPGVTDVRAFGKEFHVKLTPGSTPRAMLQQLLTSHTVDAFSEKEPDLEEIYLRAVADAGIEETREIA
jgi:ABC-2 type transport system ATP-binding protein